MKSTISYLAAKLYVNHDQLFIHRNEHCEIHILQDLDLPEYESRVIIECNKSRWQVLLITDDISGWHWHEVRNIVFDYATQNAFMGPETFQFFLACYDSFGMDDWDPMTSPIHSLEALLASGEKFPDLESLLYVINVGEVSEPQPKQHPLSIIWEKLPWGRGKVSG